METQQPPLPGATVYGADGETIGTMIMYGGSYLVVEKGFFLPKEYYIPVGAISRTREEAVYLSVTKAEVLNRGWDREPFDPVASGAQSTSGYPQNRLGGARARCA